MISLITYIIVNVRLLIDYAYPMYTHNMYGQYVVSIIYSYGASQL